MTQPSADFPPLGAILTGPHWPDRVRVVRVAPSGSSRGLIEAVTLDGQARLISRLFRRSELAALAAQALAVKRAGPERKLDELRGVIARIDLFQSGEKLLIFTELMDYEQRALRGADMELSLQEERRHLDDLRRRQTTRLAELERAAVLSLSAPEVIGVAAIVPTGTAEVSETSKISGSEMRRSDEVEQAAMDVAMAYEQQRGWTVEDVHAEGRGYDLLSHGPNDEVRYIEVKGRAAAGAVELSANEWLKAEQLGEDYWLYIVTDALRSPSLHPVKDPAHRLAEEEVVPQVRYRVSQTGWHRVTEVPMHYKATSEQ